MQLPADLVTFTEEVLNEKLHFLCSVKKPNLFKKLAAHFKEIFFLCQPN